MKRVGGLLRRAVARPWLLSRLWYRLFRLHLEGRPEDHVWYFANGANMNDTAFRERRGMCALESRAGRLRGYRLRFNVEGRPIGKAAAAGQETSTVYCSRKSLSGQVVGDDPTRPRCAGRVQPLAVGDDQGLAGRASVLTESEVHGGASCEPKRPPQDIATSTLRA
jgi:hypothetical protein